MKSMTRLFALALAASLGSAVGVGLSGTAHAQVAPSVTVDGQGTFNAHSGSATITGTFNCGNNTGFTFIDANLSQTVGRVSTVFGSFFSDNFNCTPDLSGTWTVTISPTNGAFRGGKATGSALLVVEGSGVAETTSPVKLKGG